MAFRFGRAEDGVEFKDALPHEERWGVWTDWYEVRLLDNLGEGERNLVGN